MKRKRAEPSSLTLTPDEKQEKINKYRNEINSLVKFFRDLILEKRGALLENLGKLGNSSASLNVLIASLMEESDLPLSKLVDYIFEKLLKARNGNACQDFSKASVKNTVIKIGQRLYYGVTNADDADVLEDEAESALWCWEARDLKLVPKLERASVKIRRICRRKINQRIIAVLAMISALEKSKDNENCLQELMEASEKLVISLNEVDIRLSMQNMSLQDGSEMARKKAKKEVKMLIKQMEKNKCEMLKESKKRDRKLHKEKLQSEKERKRREKEECEIQKQLKRQQEEAEKDQRCKEKEEAEMKRRLSLHKQSSIMERFLKRSKISPTSQLDTSFNKLATSRSSSSTVERMPEPVTLAMDSVMAQNCGIDTEAIWKSHLNLWHSVVHSHLSNRKIHWGTRKKPKTELVKELKLCTNKKFTYDEDLSIQKVVDASVDSNVKISQKRIRRKKLLQFDKSYSPAFYGIWPPKSQVVNSRHPFAKDPDIDYTIGSDEEWEEEESGESLSDFDNDDEDESVEGHLNGDDEDESEDGFFVPDGYLSDNEGVQSNDMDSFKLVEEIKKLPDSIKHVYNGELCTLLRQQKYLNDLTERALKKNQPLVILNLTHEKTISLSAEELCGKEKFEQFCLQTLSVRPFLGLPNVEISISNYIEDEYLKASSSKSSTASHVAESYLPQIVHVIQSYPDSIVKIVKSLHNKFPAISKSQIRNKVREISEFSNNRWQVKKEIITKLGLSISPEKNRGTTKTITTFFFKKTPTST